MSSSSGEYRYNDTPPILLAISLTIQVAIIALFNLAFLLVIFREGNVNVAQTIQHIQWLLIAFCFSLIIQCIRYFKIGSGYMIAALSPSIYLGAAVIAISKGGLPLLTGMMIFTAVCEIIFAFFIRRLKILFPKEIIGLALFIVGLQIADIGFKDAFGSNIHLNSFILFVITIGSIVITGVWAPQKLRNLGLFVGSILAVACTLIFPHYFDLSWRAPGAVTLIPVFAPPSLSSVLWFHLKFDFSLIPVFLFSALVASVRVIGVITIAKQYEDNGWKRPNFTLFKKGIFCDGLSCLFSSFFGGLGINTSPVAATISVNSKCTSRWIPIGVCIIYFILAFFPIAISTFVKVPTALIGMILAYYSVTLMISGFKVMSPQQFETREMFAIGYSIVFALTIISYPSIYQHLPTVLSQLILNPLSSGVILAVVLTFIFRLGNKKRKVLSISQKVIDSKQFDKMYADISKAWNIDKGQVRYIRSLIHYFFKAIQSENAEQDHIELVIEQQKDKISVIMRYCGKLISLFNIPQEKVLNLIEEEAVGYGLLQYFDGIYPDKIKLSSNKDQCEISFACFI